jgi:hypothetical protein
MQLSWAGRFLKHYGLLLLWGLTAIAMKIKGLLHPFDSTQLDDFGDPTGIPQGAVFYGIGITTFAVALLYLILRPWSYQRSWKRALCALMVSVPWCVWVTFLASVMGRAGILGLHAVWMWIVVMLLLVLTIISAAASADDRLLHPPIVVPTAKVVGR